MKRRINLSLHWKSYFINLIWECKAVWNAGFSLAFLLNMDESQIRWCATLFIQRFVFFFFWRIFFADGIWLWGSGMVTVTSGFSSCGGWNVASQPIGSPVKGRESASVYAASSPLSAGCPCWCPCSLTMEESGEEGIGGNRRDQSLN